MNTPATAHRLALRALLGAVLVVVTVAVGAAEPGTVRPVARAEAGGDIEFGIWVDDPKGGEPRFVATHEVPFAEEQGFGWRVKNKTPKRPVKWVETMHLPAAPSSWLGVEQSPNIQISPDGRTATTMGAAFPGDPYVQNVWYFSAGDPMGEYEVTVELEDGRKASFRFHTVLPKDGRKPAFGGVET